MCAWPPQERKAEVKGQWVRDTLTDKAAPALCPGQKHCFYFPRLFPEQTRSKGPREEKSGRRRDLSP